MLTDPFVDPAHDLVGGLAAQVGPWQLALLRRHGLRPHHHLLDLGCGTLRGGLHFIRYLDPGRYCGVEPLEVLLGHGQRLLRDAGLTNKSPKLGGFELLDQPNPLSADFALTQSVLNHLDQPRILSTVTRVADVLAPSGVWVTTGWFRDDDGAVSVGLPHTSRPDEFFKTVIGLRWFASVLAAKGLEATADPDVQHPRGQQVLVVRPI